ncbi:ATP-grasp domain-containing protein [Streptomyces marokkonensis]|uniref:ATP-grasp domain-containing protein n=1 Tax=Streptomyces marokkonensis TaxID=324855 RepID=A0ABP7SMI3_9ACTN
MVVGHREVLVFVDSDYADTPYDKWVAGTDVQLRLLVSAGKYAQYRHIDGARGFADYAGSGEADQAALETADRVRPHAVVARMEGDLLRAARLRELLGVPGQDWASASAFRDKVLMKRLVREAGIAVPEFAPVRVTMDLLGFVREHGYAVVVKPAFGSGSTGTRVLRGPGDLAELLRSGLPERAEVERFVEGPMYVVDGLVAGGEVVATFVSRYLNDCLSFQSGAYLGSVQLTDDRALIRRLDAYARQVMAALPTPSCTAFHLEVFHTPEDELVLCEVGSRTGGALSAAAILAATGFDVDQEWFRAQLGEDVSEPERRDAAGWVVFYPESGTLAALPDSPPSYVVEQRIRGVIGTEYQGGEKSGVYLAAYVVTGADEFEVARRADELADWYAAGVRWDSGAAGAF